jgi:hypothetical protein
VADENIQDLRWLVERRSQIQNLLLSLLEFADTRQEALTKEQAPGADAAQQDLFALYVGAAFSLWRAVFLNNKERKRSEIQEDAKGLLVYLVKDNTVGFTQDKSTKMWMGGYYLNNAWFRLDEALLILHLTDDPAFAEFTSLRKAGREETPFQELWVIVYNTLNHLFQMLKGEDRDSSRNITT